MSPQGVMTREQASYSPGLNSIESKKFYPGTQTRSRDKLPILSLGISKALPLSPVLVDQPATEPLTDYLKDIIQPLKNPHTSFHCVEGTLE